MTDRRYLGDLGERVARAHLHYNGRSFNCEREVGACSAC